jgi:hypothetical protein
MPAEPRRPPSSPAYHWGILVFVHGSRGGMRMLTWNSRVFFGANPEEARIRKVSKMVTLPVPLSSAPGDLPVEVLPTES